MGECSKRNAGLVIGNISMALGDGLRDIFLVLRDRTRLAVEMVALVEMLVNWRNFLAGVSIMREKNCSVPVNGNYAHNAFIIDLRL